MTDTAKDAIEKLNHTLLYGRPIRIMWSVRDPDARKSGIGNLFVKVHSINGLFLIRFVHFYSFVVMSFWKCIESYFF